MLDGIELNQFANGISMRGLRLSRCSQVPKDCGVYVVIRDTTEAPSFLPHSGAGWFKRLDPSYPDDIVRGSWVEGARIVYIGKAAGARGLRQRIGQLIDFGFGKAIGHRGGRLLWHLEDHESLHVRWQFCACDCADDLESDLISQFRTIH